MAPLLPPFRQRRPIRLLWLIDSLTLGGAEALTAAFARGVDRDRVHLSVACLKRLGGNPFEAELEAAGVDVVHLGARNLRDTGAFRRLVRLVKQEGVDLVHAHLAYASIWGAAAGRLARRPVAATLHVRPSPAPAWSREGLRQRLLVRLLSQPGMEVLAVSRAAARAWVLEAGLPAGRARVVNNGVALDPPPPAARAAVRRELAIPRQAPLVTTVSALRPGKGLEVLLSALPAVASRYPEARFLFVGDGPLRSELAARAASLHLSERVRLVGLRRDVPSVLAASDLFVLPSLEDAFPTAALEAMAAGLPVVATQTGGIPEIVEPGHTGLLVPVGDRAALAAAIEELLGRPGECRRLGEAGRRRVEERFSIAAWIDRLTAVYVDMLSGARLRWMPALRSGAAQGRGSW